MSAEAELARVLAGSGPILLDFDGPVCSIFAGYPAPTVAAELRAILTDLSVELPASVAGEPDPLEVLRWTATLGRPELTRAVEDALRAAELRAAATATPTPYAREAIVAARQIGRDVAVVSNNSTPAISAYLVAHRLAGYVDPTVGRAPYEPERMKPDPDPLFRAVAELGVMVDSCVLIGDSETDIEAGKAAGMRVIGYANKARKVAAFEAARADGIVLSMSEISLALLDASL